MSLPIVTLSQQECWDCHQCGHCCRGSVIPLTDVDLKQLRSQKWEEHEDFKETEVIKAVGNRHQLAQRPDGSCVFLNDEGLCQIHKDFGEAAKPTTCRVFPLQLIPQEKRVVLTVRRACPSAGKDLGQPVETRLPFVKQLVKQQQLEAKAITPPPIKVEEQREWKTTGYVLGAIAGLLQDPSFPMVRRVVHALQFTSLLEEAKTGHWNHDQVVKLVDVLQDACVDESAPFFQNRKRPPAAARSLFRLTALEYVRLHPGYQADQSSLARLGLANVSLKASLGWGTVPQLHPEFPKAKFKTLEQPLEHLSPDFYQPLVRMIEMAAESTSYAIANRGDWTIIDSFRNLAMTFPTAFWLLRWKTAAADREPTVEDMVNIVVALDRGQGYAALRGTQQRTRLRSLAQLGALEKLVAWYAR